MTWRILWTPHAHRDIRRLENAKARRIVSKLEAAAKDPPRFFNRLADSDDYRLRVGDYRMIVALAHDTRTIIVERIDHRSRVYER
ncbi:MAG: type II toxin-antitoxin system RelE family toxin [Thermoplasmatota archaeon]